MALQRQWATWFEGYDVLLAPAWCTPAFEHDHEGNMMDRAVMVNGTPRNHFELSQWLRLVNLLKLPATMTPIGRTAAGLTVGMQVIAPYLHDRRAIAISGLVSDVIGGYEVPPGFE